MKTLIIDGSQANDPMAARVVSALQSDLAARDWTSETIVLREKKIGNCAGDFFCWLKSPGLCAIDDDNREIAKKMIESDLVINVLPITFGGYSSTFKRALDHQIQNISPFFTTVDGEIHHLQRYETYPNVLTIGWLNASDANAEAIFRHLAYRNSINMYSKVHLCRILYTNESDHEIASSLNLSLTRAERLKSDPVPVLPKKMECPAAGPVPIRRAVLLVGSPRMRKSTSASLGDYLFEQLKQRGVETETIHLYPSHNSPGRMEKVFTSVDAADLVILAFPLYVDSLPAPVVSVLEEIASHRAEKPAWTRFAAIANCGFPEADHNDNALAVCEAFARSAGFEWIGSLSLGGGEGMVRGLPLNELGGRATPIKRSLEMAADALAAGQPIPETARGLLAKSFIPNWLYKVMGAFGWKQQAKKFGTQRHLMARPYQEAS